MFAYAPLFIQGAQGRSPMEVGLAMLALSLGWSLGSIILGQFVDRIGRRGTAVSGAVCLLVGCALTLTFTRATSISFLFAVFSLIGIGMGWVALSTLIVAQSCVEEKDLGVATSSNQFARTLGGTVGVGICGSFIATRFASLFKTMRASDLFEQLPVALSEARLGQIELLFRPEIQATLPKALQQMVQNALASGVFSVFCTVSVVAALCLLICLLIPQDNCVSK
jgi:MFS family permease